MNSNVSRQISKHIRSVPQPHCIFCANKKSTILFDGVKDRLFNAPGTWRYRKCADVNCAFIWLDPMPVAEDLDMAYMNYYTHVDPAKRDRDPRPQFQRLMHGAFSLFVRASGISAERAKFEASYLDDMKPGRVLEIGCGDGSRLLRLRAAGWDVEGQEIDPQANAFVLKRHSIRLHVGDVARIGLPEEHYHAIVMNHVIEHVPDP